MMSLIFNGFTALVRWTIFLALTGGVIQTTQELYKESGKTIQLGLVSLVDINNQLVNAKPRKIKK